MFTFACFGSFKTSLVHVFVSLLSSVFDCKCDIFCVPSGFCSDDVCLLSTCGFLHVSKNACFNTCSAEGLCTGLAIKHCLIKSINNITSCPHFRYKFFLFFGFCQFLTNILFCLIFLNVLS